MDPYTTPDSRTSGAWAYPPRKHANDLTRTVRVVRAAALIAICAVVAVFLASVVMAAFTKARADVQQHAQFMEGY